MAALCSPEQGGQGSLLSNLPTEIVIQIMKHSLNFSCLWALVKASSRFSSILMAFAWEIVEEVMIKTTPLCTQVLMKIALITRTSPDIFTGVDEVCEYATERKQLKSFPHQQMSPQVLREFVQLAHNIHAVAHACLDFYLEKLKYLKPQRIPDIDVENRERMLSVLYSEHPLPGQPFQPNLDFGPPTYLEEQRTVRQLWQFQAFLDLKAAGRTHALAHWPERDHNILAKPIVVRLIFTVYEKYQIEPVFEFVNEMTVGQSSQPENAPNNPEKGLLREEALAHFLRCPPVSIYNRGYHLSCSPKPGPILEEVLERLVDIDTKIKESPGGWRFYFNMIANRRDSSPLKGGLFKPWSKFGFEFWDDDRMVDLGFLEPRHLRYGSNSCSEAYWFVWRSILTPEEDAVRRSDVAKRYISSLNLQNKE